LGSLKLTVMKTAEEICYSSKYNDSGLIHHKDCAKLLREFAKMHVKAALEKASKKAVIKQKWGGNTNSEYCEEYVDKYSILNSYPETEVK